MKAIVFGGAGFVGSHVADALMQAGHDVTVFDVRACPFLGAGQRCIRGDMTNFDEAAAAVNGQDIVYNFAALGDIADSRRRPIDTVRLNILGNLNLLEAARTAGVKRFVFASTIYVYSESGSFYRVSKQASELYVEEYHREFGLDYTILRYGTLYGPRANEQNSICRYLKQALLDRRIIVYSSGDEIREYIHVSDAARLSVEILADQFRNEHVILTGHHRMRFRDLLAMIREIVGSDVTIELRPPGSEGSFPGESGHYGITPYAFRPKIGRKLTNQYYMDMGQGLLECLEELYLSHAPSTEEGSGERVR